MIKNISILFLFLILISSSSFGQTCGFGCLGLSGAFGGYTHQTYEADGLNNYLSNKLGSKGSDMKFSEAKGFRAGGNIVRAKFEGYFFTAKGFYQFLSESKELINVVSSNIKETYEFKANYWGVGIDLGVPIFSFLDLKLIDGGVTFLQADYEEKQFTQDDETSYTKFENDGSEIGYYFGSGLIIHLMEDYVSLEGTAFYSMMKISNMIDDSGNKLLAENSADLLSKGGFSFTVQLNIGFPL